MHRKARQSIRQHRRSAIQYHYRRVHSSGKTRVR